MMSPVRGRPVTTRPKNKPKGGRTPTRNTPTPVALPLAQVPSQRGCGRCISFISVGTIVEQLAAAGGAACEQPIPSAAIPKAVG